MATNYPTSLDALTNPISNDSLNSPSHSAQHANANDAIEAIEAKLGIGNANQVGMYHINTTDFTSASSVILSSVFSAAYGNYRILVNITQNSTLAANYIQLRTGTTNATTGNDRRGAFLFSASTVSGSGTAADSYLLLGNTGNGGRSWHTLDLASPFLTFPTTGVVMSADNDNSGGRNLFISSLYNSNSTSYESLVLGCTGGNITGNIRIYGYRESTA